MKIATANHMKQIDAIAVEKMGQSLEQLMENAGRAVTEVFFEKFSHLKRKTVGVLCGKGNNGGDGLVVARLLKQKKISVVSVIYGDFEELSPLNQLQYKKARDLNLPMLSIHDENSFKTSMDALKECTVIIDALLGIGINRAVEGMLKQTIQMTNDFKIPVLSIDIPSGLSTDSGEIFGSVIQATYTVTFGLPKIGFFTAHGQHACGTLIVRNIGFPDDLLRADFLEYESTEWQEVKNILPQYQESIHKGNRGRLVVVAGATGLTGAATLCAMAAQRIGTGLITVACPESLNSILETKLTEPMTAPVPEVEGGFFSLKAVGRILHLTTNVNAVIIGPGIGRHRETGQMLKELILKMPVPMVLDADALNLLGGQLDIFKSIHVPVIITPHPGEAAWLLKINILDVEKNRLQVAKKIANEYNITVVLKGQFTVIASPGKKTHLNLTGNRSLATAGTGDVLAGIIGGLLAQKMSPFDAAVGGVFVHGLAGERASRKLGLDGVLAGDLLPLLPKILRQVHESDGEITWLQTMNYKTNGKRFLI